CQNFTETFGYHVVWIALVSETMDFMDFASSGLSSGHDNLRKMFEQGNYPSCMRKAMESQELHVIDDYANECAGCPVFTKHGLTSALVYPLQYESRIYGVMTIGLDRKYAHEVEDQRLFIEVAEDLGFALWKIEIESARKRVDNELRQNQAVLLESQAKLREQTVQIETALAEALKSREILVSMLEDNSEIREQLEQNFEELKSVQGMLLQSQKMAAVGQLSAGVAHEVKNPLAIILLSLEALQRTVPSLGEEGFRYIDMIKSAAQRANKVVMDLMNFARYSDIKLKDVKVLDVVRQTVSLVESSARIKGAEIVCEFNIPEDTTILGDSQLIEQVLINLLSNAMDAVSDIRGKIIVRASSFAGEEETGQKLVLEVIDNGCGIPPEIIDKIFDPFFTTKKVGQGTGLGLSMVFTIIENHKGTIRAESEKGKGTKFTITLPLKDRANQPEGNNG
ncbi:MAG TPA: ATP-binding protein, partial [Candidatus Omnitrophota bacterium]|nr:ATP-binding protein [Candidatus Omnitrophota bacterium]